MIGVNTKDALSWHLTCLFRRYYSGWAYNAYSTKHYNLMPENFIGDLELFESSSLQSYWKIWLFPNLWITGDNQGLFIQ